jgi:hypothetical protein
MSTITVRRLIANSEVSRDHPSPERVRWRIEEIARGPLRRALEEVLEPLSRWEGDEVVVLKRLETSFDLDVSQSVDESARRWAAKIARAIVGVLQDGPQASGVARFRSEAAFLARFLVDRTDGHADGKWFYRRYAGLEVLTKSAALRAAILDDVERGVAALRTLDPSELERVVRALGEIDARRVVETWAKGAVDAAVLARAIEEATQGDGIRRCEAMQAASPWELAVMFVAAGREPVSSMRSEVRARAAAAVAGWLFAERSHQGRERAHGSTEEMRRAASPPAVDGTLVDPAGVLGLSPDSRARMAARLGARKEAGALPVRESTPFGGLLLLFRHLAEVPIEETWSAPRDRAIARLVVLSRCAGLDRSGRVRGDVLVRRLLGVPQELSIEEIDAWAAENAARLSPWFGDVDTVGRAAQYVLCSFARRLPGFSESSPEYLYDNFLAFPATVEEVAGRWVCRVGRPLLGTVLVLTGALRGSLEIPWLDGMSLRLEAAS